MLRSTSALSDALDALATAFNAAVDEVDKQHGNQEGALAGQTVVNDLSRVLSQMATFTGNGTVSESARWDWIWTRRGT